MPTPIPPDPPAEGVVQRMGHAAEAIVSETVVKLARPSGVPNGFIAALFLVIVLLVVTR